MIDFISDDELGTSVRDKLNDAGELMAIVTINDREAADSVRAKLNAMINEINATEYIFGLMFFAAPNGNSLNLGTTPGSPWDLAKVNSHPFPANSTVTFQDGFYTGGLTLAAALAPVTCVGVGSVYIGGIQDLTAAVWVDNGGALSGTWTYDFPSAALPARCIFEASWLDDSRSARLAKSPVCIARASTQAEVSINILAGGVGDWTQLRQNIWTKNTTLGLTSGRVLSWLSFNNGTPKQGKLFQGDLAVEGDFFVSGSANLFAVYSPNGNPATAWTTARASCGWHCSTISGTTRRATVFSPGQAPSLTFTEILMGGNNTGNSLTLSMSGHVFRNIQFCGAAFGFVTSTGVTNIVFDYSNIRACNTRGGLVADGCDRWTIKGVRVSDNGLINTEGAYGLRLGAGTTTQVHDILLFDSDFIGNGEDGLQFQMMAGCVVSADNCLMLHNSENGTDMKGNEDFRIANSLLLSSIMATGAGNDAITQQLNSRLFARHVSFIGTLGLFDPSSAGKTSIRSAATGYIENDNCVWFGSSFDAVSLGDGDSGPSITNTGKFIARGTLLVGTRKITNGAAIRLSMGDLHLQHCTVGNKTATVGGRAIRQTPGSGVNQVSTTTVQSSVIENSILDTDGTGSSAYVYERGATALNNVTTVLTNNLYNQRANPTNWMSGGDGNLYTPAAIDAGIAQVGFTVVNSVTDPTIDPMFDNPWEGGLSVCTSDLRGVGNWRIGGTLIHLTCSAISAAPHAPNLGEKVTGVTSGATGYVRNVFANGLLLSSVNGTFVAEDLRGQWGTVVGTVSAVSAALTLKMGFWDAQTVNFSTFGQVVTGSISGHTGILVNQVDAGASGQMILAVAAGVTFADNDVVSGASEGSCTFDRVLQNSAARRGAPTIYPRIRRSAPATSFVPPVDKGTLHVSFGLNATGSDTLSVVNATKTWTRSSASSWVSAGLEVGMRFTTQKFNPAIIDVGGPYTVTTIPTTNTFTTVEAPGADVTNDVNAGLFMYGNSDIGCYAIT